MNYLSVCSGIEAATVAWHHMGWNPIGFSEIEKFPSEVLKHHYPHVPNLGDMTKFKEWNLNGTIDLLVGGTPCQSFSVAGLRKGLDDPRGNLMLTYLAIAAKYKPTWIVWENVPGVLSSNGGHDFASLLRGLGELGYGFAYRILDAQYFGVPQRRRRVFVVGCLGSWQRAAAVLFDSTSLSGNPPPSREKRQRTSTYVADIVGTLCARDYKGLSTNDVNEGKAIVYDHHPQDSRIKEVDVSPTLNCRLGNLPIAQTVAYNITTCDANGTRKDRPNGGLYVNETEVSNTITQQGVGTVAHAFKIRGGCEGGGKGYLGSDETAFTLSTTQDQQIAIAVDTYNGTLNHNSTQTIRGTGSVDHVGGTMHKIAPTLTTNNPSRSPQSTEITNQIAAVHAATMAVRRLTPVECERLQGFPDNYTNIRINCPDGPRYKALGNSMAVPVMKWIGERIQMVENLLIRD
jgi:DNA (cytosine-5)-methyltransferase 1